MTYDSNEEIDPTYSANIILLRDNKVMYHMDVAISDDENIIKKII